MKEYLDAHPEAKAARVKTLIDNPKDKAIICLETGIIYKSLTDAAE